MTKIAAVVGARPNFMKIAPIMWEVARRSGVEVSLIHTGQHYDYRMSQLFFDQLRIPKPDIDLEVGSGSHAMQTAEVMKRFEPVLLQQKPDLVMVVGDVNSTLACTLVAAKLGVPVAHVEAGLRSFDRSMPEEINRVITDALSRWLLVSERSGVANLKHEGIDNERVFFVGNVMIDTLLAMREEFERSPILQELGLSDRQGSYAVVTLHRPSNVDNSHVLRGLLRSIAELQTELPVVFPLHPRTRRQMQAVWPEGMGNVHLIEPLGYLDFMKLVANARLVLTDSGGIQEETTVLGIACLTLRSTTERPATIECGTNVLVKSIDPVSVTRAWRRVLRSPARFSRMPELWDGKAAHRIMDVLLG